MKEESKTNYEFKPLIKQVCENVIRTKGTTLAQDHLQDIEYRTTNAGGEGFKDLFKSFKIGFVFQAFILEYSFDSFLNIISPLKIFDEYSH